MSPKPSTNSAPQIAPTLKPLLILVLILAALFTRVPGLWRMDATNDEMIHLQSYRNHYDSDDINPEFNERLSSLKMVPKPIMDKYLALYKRSTAVQRLPLLLIDAHPPIHPVGAELIEATTHSSLLALRIFSLIASLAAIALVFAVGREYWDFACGLLAASLTTVCLSAQLYAGVGRSYSLAQAATAAALLAFMRQQKEPRAHLGSFFAIMLFAQASDWMDWALAAPLIVCALVAYSQEGGQFWEAIRKTWWYMLASFVMLVEFAVQVKNPMISQQFHHPSLSEIWGRFVAASPLAQLTDVGIPSLIVGGLFLLGVAGGVLTVATDGARTTVERTGLIAAAIVAASLAVFKGSDVRFLMVSIMTLIPFAAIAVRRACRGELASALAAGALTVLIGALAFMRPENPYSRVFPEDTNYSAVADRLTKEMKPNDIWVSLPYFRGNDLYRYGHFPTPLQPRTDAEQATVLKQCTTTTPCYVFAQSPIPPSYQKAADKVWKFGEMFSLLRIKPKNSETRKQILGHDPEKQ